MMMGYDSLTNFYKTNFNLVQFHKYTLSDIERMMPWERHLFVDLLKDHIEAENEKARDQQSINNRTR
jgi:hypothetical protein